MKIAILLPFKEIYRKVGAGAVSILVHSHLKSSIYKKSTKIYGLTVSNPMDKNKFVPLKSDKFFKNKSYVSDFAIKLDTDTKIIEIHNRPKYFFFLKKKFPYKKFILFFHNDPNELEGSSSAEERSIILNSCDKIIFLSKWIKAQFVKDLACHVDVTKLVVFYPGVKGIKKFPNKKKKTLVFVGKLNSDKGYDIYLEAVNKFLETFKSWKSIAIGSEKRRVIPASFNTKEYGQISNDRVLRIYEHASIAVGNSVRDEPLGRLPIEASSRGCLSIVSNKGGLPETLDKNSLVLKINTSEEIFKTLTSLAMNEKKLLTAQKKIFNNFIYDLESQTSILDGIRKPFAKQNKTRNLKILHITNFNERFNGRLHYNTGKRLTNGLIRLGHNVLVVSDRDILHKNKSILDPDASKVLNKRIIETHLNFKADLIIIGHADAITSRTIVQLKMINDVKICQWFLDPLVPKGPDYIKNKNRISKLQNEIDATFLTTSPDVLNFKLKNSYYIPNPVDPAFEMLNVYNNSTQKDLFFAMSHGVHRGILKKGKIDGREMFLKKLQKITRGVIFDTYGMNNTQPVWGDNFLQAIGKSSMGLNLSRGRTFKYYSSDRIAQLMGNGLLTFIDKKTKLSNIIKNNEAIFYTDINDLSKKLIYYKNKDKLRKKIAKNGQQGAFKRFNSNVVAEYIINKTFKKKITKKFNWQV